MIPDIIWLHHSSKIHRRCRLPVVNLFCCLLMRCCCVDGKKRMKEKRKKKKERKKKKVVLFFSSFFIFFPFFFHFFLLVHLLTCIRQFNLFRISSVRHFGHSSWSTSRFQINQLISFLLQLFNLCIQ